MKFKTVLMLAVASVFVSSPVSAKNKKPELTPMELQALQSKEFETTKETLFAAVMGVFQDLGYQIDNADVQTGFINAASASGNKTNFLEALGGMQSSGNTRVTAFVEKMGNGMTKVRINFLNTKFMSSGYGQQSRQDKPVLDPIVYQTAWDKIDEALFVRQAIDALPPPAPRPVVVAAPTSTVTQAPVTPPSKD